MQISYFRETGKRIFVSTLVYEDYGGGGGTGHAEFLWD
jgi:hypothetical protein